MLKLTPRILFQLFTYPNVHDPQLFSTPYLWACICLSLSLPTSPCVFLIATSMHIVIKVESHTQQHMTYPAYLGVVQLGLLQETETMQLCIRIRCAENVRPTSCFGLTPFSSKKNSNSTTEYSACTQNSMLKYVILTSSRIVFVK